jgi:hypothetical protein
LRKALVSCIQVSLQNGDIQDLAALFDESGSTVNPKLKQLIGQVKLYRFLFI